MASYRYRCEIPRQALSELGESVSINRGIGEVIVFSKPVEDDVRLARECKAEGAKIVFDVCDPHFHFPHYREMAQIADVCIGSTPATRDFVDFPLVDTIPDPYEFPRMAPHCRDNNVIWFGHQVNYKDIEPYQRICTKIITGPDPKPGTTFYSHENLERGLKEASFALFPTSRGQEYKSNNRVLNALQMGVFPICDPHPSYEEFKDYIWTGGIPTGMRWARHFQQNLNGLITKAQNIVEQNYSPQAIGKRWQSLLNSI